MNTAEWVLKWFLENGECTMDSLEENRDNSYFEQGFIDSFKFILLMSSIENDFGISFDNDQFQDRSFSTINGLIKAIEAKR